MAEKSLTTKVYSILMEKDEKKASIGLVYASICAVLTSLDESELTETNVFES